MEGQKYVYKNLNHAGNLNEMRLQDKWCDVTIRVNKISEIRAHKVILAANLKYFNTMLSNDSFRESKEAIINMESLEEADLEAFVSYAYTGEILLTDSNALNMLEISNYFSEEGIKEACIEFLKDHLRKDEACRAYKFSNSVGCLALQNAARIKILQNFGELSMNADFSDFDYENLMYILSDGKAQPVKSQQMFFEGILRWVLHDVNNRKMHIRDLLSLVDITKLTADYVMGCLYETMTNRTDDYGIVKGVTFFYQANKIEEKKQKQILSIISRATGGNQFFDFDEKNWSAQHSNQGVGGISFTNSAILNRKICYVSKGLGVNNLQAFDPLTKYSTVLHSSKDLLRWSAVCACERFVYLCGGMTENNSKSAEVFRYDSETNFLETLTLMVSKRSSAAAIFYGGFLYVLGGNNGSFGLAQIEKYDPDEKTWTDLPPMSQARCGHAVAILDGKLYACGGIFKNVKINSVEVYDLATNSWRIVASMKQNRSYFVVIAYEKKLLAIGGNEENTISI